MEEALEHLERQEAVFKDHIGRLTKIIKQHLLEGEVSPEVSRGTTAYQIIGLTSSKGNDRGGENSSLNNTMVRAIFEQEKKLSQTEISQPINRES